MYYCATNSSTLSRDIILCWTNIEYVMNMQWVWDGFAYASMQSTSWCNHNGYELLDISSHCLMSNQMQQSWIFERDYFAHIHQIWIQRTELLNTIWNYQKKKNKFVVYEFKKQRAIRTAALLCHNCMKGKSFRLDLIKFSCTLGMYICIPYYGFLIHLCDLL